MTSALEQGQPGVPVGLGRGACPIQEQPQFFPTYADDHVLVNAHH